MKIKDKNYYKTMARMDKDFLVASNILRTEINRLQIQEEITRDNLHPAVRYQSWEMFQIQHPPGSIYWMEKDSWSRMQFAAQNYNWQREKDNLLELKHLYKEKLRAAWTAVERTFSDESSSSELIAWQLLEPIEELEARLDSEISQYGIDGFHEIDMLWEDISQENAHQVVHRMGIGTPNMEPF